MTTYNPATPQAPDIPSDSQDDFLTNFDLLNQFFGVDHIAFGTTVTSATNANPCVCKAVLHGLANGNTIHIAHFGSLVGDIIQLWNINGGPYTVTVIDADTFSINADASANPPYLENTGAFECDQFNYGFHKQVTFPNVLSVGPNNSPPRGAPASAFYTKLVEMLPQLFFQNGVNQEQQLTGIQFKQDGDGMGFVTPWGLILNFGPIAVSSTFKTFKFSVPYTSSVWSINLTLQQPPVTVTKQFLLPIVQFVDLLTFQAKSAVLPGNKPATSAAWYIAVGV